MPKTIEQYKKSSRKYRKKILFSYLERFHLSKHEIDIHKKELREKYGLDVPE